MALISFKDWRNKFDEASPTTRLRDEIMRGNHPMSAGVAMSRSTPHPEFVKKAIKEFGTPDHPKKKRKSKRKKKKGQ
jgi:hypothetical protein